LKDIEKVGDNAEFNMQSCSSPAVLIKQLMVSSK